MYMKLKALDSWIFLYFTSFWRNSYEYTNKSARRGAQFVPIGMPTTCWNSIPPKETNSGQISTTIYDKRDDFNFNIIYFPNMCSNISASPAYGVYISQLIRYARTSSSSGGYINGRNSANLELLIDKTSSIRMYMKLKALDSWIFLSFTNFWRNSDWYGLLDEGY
jgi:hypothetical protein